VLSEIDIRTPQGSLLTLALEEITDGISVQNIEGLDPVEATIITSNLAGLNGTQYHSSSRGDREIKLTLGMEEEPGTFTVEQIRKRLYKFMMPGRPVTLTFRNSEGLQVDISGHVKSFPAPLFTADPVADITVLCNESDFVNMTPVVVPGATVSSTTTFDIDYDGDVEAGITFDLNVNRSLTEFTIYSQSADGVLQQLDFAAPLVSGQLLRITTTPGAKSAMVSTGGGSPVSILYGVAPTSTWVELQPGVNTIRVYAEGAPIPFNITYLTRYGGL
jgi:hypothetical protein